MKLKLIRAMCPNDFAPILYVITDYNYTVFKFKEEDNIEEILAELDRSQPEVAAFLREQIASGAKPESGTFVLNFISSAEAEARQELIYDWKRKKKATEDAEEAKRFPFKR